MFEKKILQIHLLSPTSCETQFMFFWISSWINFQKIIPLHFVTAEIYWFIWCAVWVSYMFTDLETCSESIKINPNTDGQILGKNILLMCIHVLNHMVIIRQSWYRMGNEETKKNLRENLALHDKLPLLLRRSLNVIKW